MSRFFPLLHALSRSRKYYSTGVDALSLQPMFRTSHKHTPSTGEHPASPCRCRPGQPPSIHIQAQTVTIALAHSAQTLNSNRGSTTHTHQRVALPVKRVQRMATTDRPRAARVYPSITDRASRARLGTAKTTNRGSWRAAGRAASPAPAPLPLPCPPARSLQAQRGRLALDHLRKVPHRQEEVLKVVTPDVVRVLLRGVGGRLGLEDAAAAERDIGALRAKH